MFFNKGCVAPARCNTYKFVVGRSDMEICQNKIKCLRNQTVFTTNGHSSNYCDVHEMPYVSQLLRQTGLDTWHDSRNTLVAIGFSGYGHGLADKKGYGQWRRDLKKLCWTDYKLSCKSLFPNLSGTNIRPIMDLYNQSVFCLNPPGDNLLEMES